MEKEETVFSIGGLIAMTIAQILALVIFVVMFIMIVMEHYDRLRYLDAAFGIRFWDAQCRCSH